MQSLALEMEGGNTLRLIDSLEDAFQAYRFHGGSGTMDVLVHEESYERGYSASVTIIIDRADKDVCHIELVQNGLGKEYPWAESATDMVYKFIKTFADENGNKIRIVKSITPSKYLPGGMPRSFMKTCIKCGQKIPIASEECKYCGAHQPEARIR
jgi:hypothetical protein